MSQKPSTYDNTKEIDAVSNTLKAFPYLSLAILFGSVANNTARFESDIDLAVLAEKPLTASQKIKIIEALADATGRAIDLIDIKTAGIPIMSEVIQGKRLLGTDEVFGTVCSRHLIDAADFLPIIKRTLKERRDAWLTQLSNK